MKDSELIQAMRQIAVARGVGVVRDDGSVYLPGETALLYGPIGTTPDRAVGFTRYGGTPDQTYDGDRGPRLVQARIRGAADNPTSADDLADEVDAAFRRLTRVAGISSRWASGPLPLGADGNRRTELTLNYLVTPED